MHAGLRSALFGSALPLAGFDLGLDFKNSWYRSGGVVTRDVTALPAYSYARAGAKYEDIGGVLTECRAGQPAIIPGAGYIVRPAYTNVLRNSAARGGIGGVANAGTAPTNWAVPPAGSNVQRDVAYRVDVATGATICRVRWYGKNDSTGPLYPIMTFENPSFDVAMGQTWSLSAYVTIVAGADGTSGGVTGNRALSLGIDGNRADGAYNEGARVRIAPNGRSEMTRTLVQATTVKLSPYVGMLVAPGETIDITFDVWLPSIVQGPVAGPVIMTTNGAVTLPDDDLRFGGPVPNDEDWVAVVSAMLPVAAASVQNQPIGLLFFTNPAGGGNFIYVGRQPSGTLFVSAASGGPTVATVSANVPHAAAGRHVAAFGRRAGKYFFLTKNPGGTIGTMAFSTDQPMPIGLGRIMPGRRDIAGAAIDGPVEFAGWRRGTFTDDQVRTILAAI